MSAWWGQYESIFVVSALGAVVLAANGRNGPAAALIAVALMTKPQAVPFLIPFAAWFWATGYRAGPDGVEGGARGGALELVRTGLIGLATSVVLWLPFIPAGGPANYLQNLATYQNEVFDVLSLRAWNVWWLVQEAAAGGEFIADDVAFLGPITLRHVGYLVTGGLSLVIALAIIRDPRPRTLVLGLAASVLVFFTFMTQMHERYAYAALIFLVLVLPERRLRWLWAVFGVVFTLNLLAAVPPDARDRAAPPGRRAIGDRRVDRDDRPDVRQPGGASPLGRLHGRRTWMDRPSRSSSTARMITTIGTTSTSGNARAAASQRFLPIAGRAIAT